MIGLIVESTGEYLGLDNPEGEIGISDAVPKVVLSKNKKSKSVIGVIGEFETDSTINRKCSSGTFVSVIDKDVNRLTINSIGEGAIWVVNTNGNFENGDFIQSSNVPGYGEKQDDDFLHNYTVGKVTMNVDFANIPSKFKTRMLDGGVIAVMVGCIYYSG